MRCRRRRRRGPGQAVASADHPLWRCAAEARSAAVPRRSSDQETWQEAQEGGAWASERLSSHGLVLNVIQRFTANAPGRRRRRRQQQRRRQAHATAGPDSMPLCSQACIPLASRARLILNTEPRVCWFDVNPLADLIGWPPPHSVDPTTRKLKWPEPTAAQLQRSHPRPLQV